MTTRSTNAELSKLAADVRALGLQTQAVIKGCAAAMATLGAWITSTSSALPALALLDDDGMAERVRQLQEDAALVLEMQNQLCEHVRPLEQTVSSTRYGSMELRDKLHLLPKQAASVQKSAPGLRAMQAVLSAEDKQSGQAAAETKQQQPKEPGKRASRDEESKQTAQPPAKQAAPATQHRPRIRAREILRAALLDAFGALVGSVPGGVVALVAEYARMPQFVGTIEPAVPAQRKEPVRGLRTDRGLKSAWDVLWDPQRQQLLVCDTGSGPGFGSDKDPETGHVPFGCVRFYDADGRAVPGRAPAVLQSDGGHYRFAPHRLATSPTRAVAWGSRHHPLYEFEPQLLPPAPGSEDFERATRYGETQVPCRDPLTLPENQQIDEMSVALLGDYCLVGDVKPQVHLLSAPTGKTFQRYLMPHTGDGNGDGEAKAAGGEAKGPKAGKGKARSQKPRQQQQPPPPQHFTSVAAVACSARQGGIALVAGTTGSRSSDSPCDVQVFSLRDGKFLRKWGSRGTGDGQFGGIRNIAVNDEQGLVAVSDAQQQIQVFDLGTGAFVCKFGAEIAQYAPAGLAIGPQGTVYVCDKNTVAMWEL